MNKYLKRFSLCALMTTALLPVSAADETETWKDLGTGQWRDNMIDNYYMLDHFYQFDVQIQESEQTPGRYRVVNPYLNYPNLFGTLTRPEEDCYIIFDASDPVHAYIEAGLADFVMPGTDLQLVLWSIADDYYFKNGDWEQADEENVCGKLENGCITFTPRSILVGLYDMINDKGVVLQNGIYKAANSHGKFRLRLPDAPKLDMALSYLTYDADAQTIAYNLTMEDDIETVKYALVKGDYTEAASESIISGSTASEELSGTGDFTIAYPGDGVYTMVAVGFFNGKPIATEYVTREFSFNNEEWIPVAEQGLLKESILSSNDLREQGLILESYSFPVSIEQHKDKKNYIRLVNPYINYPLSSELNYDYDHNYYMVFDVTDPDFVLLETAEDGLGINLGYGAMKVTSRAYRYLQENLMTREEIINSNLAGKFRDDVITFPEESFNIMFTGVVQTWYFANNDGTFSLQLPKGLIDPNASVEEVATENATPVYYRLDGTKVSGNDLESGLYIEVKGAKARKIAVK